MCWVSNPPVTSYEKGKKFTFGEWGFVFSKVILASFNCIMKGSWKTHEIVWGIRSGRSKLSSLFPNQFSTDIDEVYILIRLGDLYTMLHTFLSLEKNQLNFIVTVGFSEYHPCDMKKIFLREKDRPFRPLRPFLDWLCQIWFREGQEMCCTPQVCTVFYSRRKKKIQKKA